MNFTISLKAFPERPKLKQLFLLENLEVNRRINFFCELNEARMLLLQYPFLQRHDHIATCRSIQ
jgi:hypothetical protein